MLSMNECWRQADAERPGDPDARGRRYIELMKLHGHIVPREPGDDSPLFACGYDPRRGTHADPGLVDETL